MIVISRAGDVMKQWRGKSPPPCPPYKYQPAHNIVQAHGFS